MWLSQPSEQDLFRDPLLWEDGVITHLHSPAPRVDAPCSARAFHRKLSLCILLHLTVNQNKLYDPGQVLNLSVP